MRKILHILTALVMTLPTFAEISWRIAPYETNVVAGGLTRFTLEASCSGQEQYSIRTPRLESLKGALVQDINNFNRTVAGNGGFERRYCYVIDLMVTNAPGSDVETGAILLDYRPYGSADFVNNSVDGPVFHVGQRFGAGKIAACGGGLLIVLALSWLFLARRRNARKTVPAETSLEEVYLAELSEARGLRLRGEVREYFWNCEEILRRYLREKYAIARLEDWKPEDGERQGLDRRLVRSSLELCRLSFDVRYAGHVPSPQEEGRMFEFINELLNRNLPERGVADDNLYLKK